MAFQGLQLPLPQPLKYFPDKIEVHDEFCSPIDILTLEVHKQRPQSATLFRRFQVQKDQVAYRSD